MFDYENPENSIKKMKKYGIDISYDLTTPESVFSTAVGLAILKNH